MSASEIKQYLLQNLEDTKLLEEYLYNQRQSNPREVIQATLDLLSSPEERIRAEAMWFIEMLEPQDSYIVPFLLVAAKDSNLYVKSHATVYLMERNWADLTGEVISILHDSRIDCQTRCRAALTLGRQDSRDAVDALIQCLDDDNPSLVWNVMHAIAVARKTCSADAIVIDKLKNIQAVDSRTTLGGESLSKKAIHTINSLNVL